MSTTTVSGTTVTISSSGAAVTDTYSGLTGLTDGSLGTVTFDVMSNDGGGTKTILYSLDDGVSGATYANKAIWAPTDLLTQDAATTEALSSDHSLLGATIWITSDGKVGYDASTLSADALTALHALDSGQYLTDSFTYAIKLANGTLSWSTVTVELAGITETNTAPPAIDLDANDSSGATGADYTTTYVENAAGIAISDVDLSVTDADSTTMASATITLTNAKDGDVMSIAGGLPVGVTSSVDTSVAGVITVTLTGSASLASYQTAIGSIRYSNTGDAPDTTTRDVTVVVNDGHADSNTAHTSIAVVAVNDAPVGADNTVTVLEDHAYTFAASAFGFSDANDSPANSLLAVEISTLPTAGALTLNGVAVTAGQFVSASDITAGNLTFTPAANGTGSGYASFTFQVQDDGGTANGGVDTSTTPNTMTLNVTPVNDAPVGADNTVSVLEDHGYTFAASDFGFSDPNDSPANSLLAVEISSLPAAGALLLNGVVVTAGQFVSASDIAAGLLTFNPAANANGAGYASFTFQVQDDGGIANGGVDTSTTPNTMTLNVTPVNDAPSGTSNTVTVLEDHAYTFAASAFGFSDANDSPANSLLAVEISTLPTAGALTLNGVAVTAGQFVSASDIATGLLTFNPAANANGTGYASFTFQVQDDGGTANGGTNLDPTANTLTINVTSVNDAPSGANNTVTTNEDTAYTFAVSDFGFTDPNDSPANSLLAVKIDTLPAAGALTLSGIAVFAGEVVTASGIAAGHLVFTPAANANGTGYASFNFQVVDNGGTANGGVNLDPTANTITLNVTPVNDAPVNTVPGAQTVNEDTWLAITGLSISDVDAGSAAVQVTLSALHGNLNLTTATGLTFSDAPGDHQMVFTGTLTDIDAALATLIYRGDLDYNGSDTLSITTNDLGNTGAGGALSDTDTVGITVNAVNDAPVNTVPGAQIVNQSEVPVLPGLSAIITGVSVADVDLGGGIIQVSLSSDHGNLFVYTSGLNLTFLDAAGDHSLVISGTLTAVNTALSELTYQADANYFGSDTLTMTSNDLGNTGAGGPLSDTDTVAITVAEPPTAVNDAWIVTNQTVVSFGSSAVLWNDTDPDGHALSVTGVEGADGIMVGVGVATTTTLGATLTLLADGSLQYNAGSALGADSFTYQVSDDHGGINTATVSLSVLAQSSSLSVEGASYDHSYLSGGVGNDALNGGAGVDYLFGGAGNDVMTAHQGNDWLDGGAGNDNLAGGQGQDTLTGGSGTNTFSFASIGASGNTPSTADVITDWSAGTNNKIDVSGLIPGTPLATGGANIGSTPLANGIWATVSGNDTVLHFDTNGNPTTDEMDIVLQNFTGTLHATDFNL